MVSSCLLFLCSEVTELIDSHFVFLGGILKVRLNRSNRTRLEEEVLDRLRSKPINSRLSPRSFTKTWECRRNPISSLLALRSPTSRVTTCLTLLAPPTSATRRFRWKLRTRGGVRNANKLMKLLNIGKSFSFSYSLYIGASD